MARHANSKLLSKVQYGSHATGKLLECKWFAKKFIPGSRRP